MTELEILKKKSPSDLWREDLALFTEELEVQSDRQLVMVESFLPQQPLITSVLDLSASRLKKRS